MWRVPVSLWLRRPATLSDEDITGPTVTGLGTTDLDVDDSWGLALETGMDIEIQKKRLFSIQLWYAVLFWTNCGSEVTTIRLIFPESNTQYEEKRR